jgi:hypothetical protein
MNNVKIKKDDLGKSIKEAVTSTLDFGFGSGWKISVLIDEDSERVVNSDFHTNNIFHDYINLLNIESWIIENDDYYDKIERLCRFAKIIDNKKELKNTQKN